MLEISLKVYENGMQEGTEPEAKVTNITQFATPAENTRLEGHQYTFAATGDANIAATGPQGEQDIISTANLDGGTFTMGTDYYIFATVENGRSYYAISQDKFFNPGHLVGGFHYGKNRRTDKNLQPVNASGKVRGEGWEANVYDGIIPFSIWTPNRRPKCDPEGMVRLPTGLWVDIYQASDDGAGGLVSAYDAMPLTGEEGYNWFSFSEMALVKGKRLLSLTEWWQMALGSPEGLDDDNTNAWSAEDNDDKQRTGYVANAVSSFGCRDAVGNVWEWLNDITPNMQGDNWKWHNPMPGYGRIFAPGHTGLTALLAGGRWTNGVDAGARTVYLYYYPWHVTPYIGARCACDSL